MEVFLSWSGDRSKEVAKVLREWLPKVIQNLSPWISASDIDKGSRWLKEISEKLEDTDFGILCLTPENLNEPWILFEAGALSKAIGSSHICPVMLDFDCSSLKGPLSQFQATKLQKDDMIGLVRTINKTLGENGLSDSQLDETFSMWWPKLEEALQNIPSPATKAAPERSEKDILIEILQIVRGLDRNQNPLDEERLMSISTAKVLATLTPREEKMLRMRFGIGVEAEKTEAEIAKEFDIPTQMVSRNISNALRKLRQPSRAKMLSDSLSEILKGIN